MFQIVCFAVPPAKTLGNSTFWAYTNLTLASFKKLNSKVRAILLTKKKAPIPKGLLFDKVLRSHNASATAHGLMVDELNCWVDFVKSDLFDRPTILIDPDLLCQHDISSIFEDPFDIGLTWRDVSDEPTPETFSEIYRTQPFNAGVIFLRPYRKAIVINFFENCFDSLENMDQSFWAWYGDQEALLHASGKDHKFNPNPDTWHHNGTVFKAFPCDLFNFSQPYTKTGDYKLQCFNEPHIVHFKGERSKLMFRYAQEFLGISLAHDRKQPGGIKITI